MKTPLLLSFVILALVNCFVRSETPPVVFLIGTERIKVSPPFGFSECSKTTPFLSRYFAGVIPPKHITLGGFLTDKEFQLASTGAEPARWHMAYACCMEEFRTMTLEATGFAGLRKHYRDNIKEDVRAIDRKMRKRIEKPDGSASRPPGASESVFSEGLFLDDASSFAHLSKSVAGESVRAGARGFVLIHGKVIILDLNKVCLSDADVEWLKAAMKWWIDKLRADNP